MANPIRPSSGLKSAKQILQKKIDWEKDKYISQEFQLYGYHLAEELGDMGHKSMYMKFAKEIPRALLEEAKNFVKGAGQVQSRGRLFMWKLSELRKRKVVGNSFAQAKELVQSKLIVKK